MRFGELIAQTMLLLRFMSSGMKICHYGRSSHARVGALVEPESLAFTELFVCMKRARRVAFGFVTFSQQSPRPNFIVEHRNFCQLRNQFAQRRDDLSVLPTRACDLSVSKLRIESAIDPAVAGVASSVVVKTFSRFVQAPERQQCATTIASKRGQKGDQRV